jgi:methionyl-tRNA synthetase
MAGQKMSKSRGRFILLQDIKLPSDYVRYYLTAITPNSTADVNFTWDELKEKVNKELVDAYGNFVHRSLSFIVNKVGGVVPAKGEATAEDDAFEKETSELLERAAKQYDAADFKRALEECMAFAGKANKYFNDRAPWKLIKEAPGQAQTVLYNSARAVYALSVALNPILPESTTRALSMLGLEAKWDANAFKPNELKEVAPLFEKIQDEA